MRPRQNTITSSEVHGLALGHVLRFLDLADHGAKVTASVLVRVLLWAAARLAPLAAACEALISALRFRLPRRPPRHPPPELTRRLNRALRGGVPRILRRGSHAIDLTLLPFHGKPEGLALHVGQE